MKKTGRTLLYVYKNTCNAYIYIHRHIHTYTRSIDVGKITMYTVTSAATTAVVYYALPIGTYIITTAYITKVLNGNPN